MQHTHTMTHKHMYILLKAADNDGGYSCLHEKTFSLSLSLSEMSVKSQQ